MGAAHGEFLRVMAQAKEVLGETALFFVAAAALHDGIGAEAFGAETGEELAGGDVAVSCGPAGVGLLGEHAGGDVAEVVQLDGAAFAGVVNRSVAFAETANGGDE